VERPVFTKIKKGAKNNKNNIAKSDKK